jgi:DNA-binding phage protein
MYDTLGRREQAIARYRKAITSDQDGEYLAAARKHLRHPYQFSE